jgi:polysaccharide biosynthesis transport protein
VEPKYYRPLIKRWWLLVAAVLIAVLSSFLVTRQQPLIYQARATLMVGSSVKNPNPNGNDFFLTQQLAATYADIAMREPLRNAVMKKLGMEWLPFYTAAMVPNTQLIELAVSDTSPERAQAVANALASELISQSPTSSDQEQQSRQAFINRQLDELEANIKQTRDEIAKKQAELAGLFSARQIADAQTQVAALQSKLGTLQSNYAAMLANSQSGATNTLSIIEQASLPITPIGPKKDVTIALAAAIGFVLAASAAYLLEYLDDTIKSAEDVQATLGLATLGGIPLMKDILNDAGHLLALPPVALESYNMLCTNLQFAAVGHPLRTFLVTSPVPYEGKSLTAANLGVMLAQTNERVILVDLDLRRPQMHKLLNLNNQMGVTSVLLQKQSDLQSALQFTATPGLRLLSAGPLPPNPPALLGSEPMHRLLALLSEEADIVILDSPPTVAFADAAILSTQVDGVLLVLSAGHSRRAEARQALASLNRAQAPVLGVLLNRMPPSSSNYHYYYHYYNQERRSLLSRWRNVVMRPFGKRSTVAQHHDRSAA